MEIDLEVCVIRAILVNPSCFDDVLEHVETNDFTTNRTRDIFGCICELKTLDQPHDLFAVSDRVGHLEWMGEITANGADMTGKTAAMLLERASFKRKACGMLEDARLQVMESKSIDDQLSIIHSLNDKLEKKSDDVPEFKDVIKDCLLRLENRMNGVMEHRVKTGFDTIDERLTGFAPSNLVIVAGRPAMGKTTYAMNIAENVALAGGNVVVFSMEMSKEELIDRMLSSLSGLEAEKIKRGSHLTNEEDAKLHAGVHKLQKMMNNIIVCDKPAMHINHMTNYCRKINRKKKLDLIVVDYLQLMRTDAKNRFEEISEVSRGLKSLAKLCDVPVLALSQLSRGVDSRTNNRPVNSDLRESGQIEQDADLIQFLYRDEMYNSDSTHKGVCEVITTKFRSGEVGTDYLKSELHKNRFVKLEYTPQSEPEKQEYRYGK